MKKVYVTPEIAFESFALTTSISAGCDVLITTMAENQCAIPDSTTGMFMVFSGSILDCEFHESDDEYDGLCYHVSTENNPQMFNSI